MLIPYAEQQLDTVAGVRDSLVNQRLILQCEYLIAKNRVLRRRAAPLGRRALYPWEIASGWREVSGGGLIARKFDGSRRRSYQGRPRVGPELEALIIGIGLEEQRLGLRSHCWRSRQSRPTTLQSDDRKHSEAPLRLASA